MSLQRRKNLINEALAEGASEETAVLALAIATLQAQQAASTPRTVRPKRKRSKASSTPQPSKPRPKTVGGIRRTRVLQAVVLHRLPAQGAVSTASFLARVKADLALAEGTVKGFAYAEWTHLSLPAFIRSLERQHLILSTGGQVRLTEKGERYRRRMSFAEQALRDRFPTQ